MHEKKLPFEPILENFWEKRENFIRLNPIGTVPVLVKKQDLLRGNNTIVVTDQRAIVEFLEEMYPETSTTLPGSPQERAAIRSIVSWFDIKMFHEVTQYIIYERYFNTFNNNMQPNNAFLQTARMNIEEHMRYIEYLLQKNNNLASDNITLADISAASQISTLDYFDEIQWSRYPEIKSWYAVIKSRPSFRQICQDRVASLTPPEHYSELDF